MAKQGGPFIWEKTIGCLCLYKRLGKGYARMKSNLTAKRWRSDPAFEGSRRSAACMALASQLASPFYQGIPLHQRSYPYYKRLVGIAQHMLCVGYNIEQVNKVLRFTVSRYLRKLQAGSPAYKPIRSPFAATLSLTPKPTYKPAMLQPMTVPLWNTATAGKSIVGQLQALIPPRGSPAAIPGCVPNTGNLISRSLLHTRPGKTPATAIQYGRAYYVHTAQICSSIE